MCFQTESRATEVSSYAPKIGGNFGTGKGTTARIFEALNGILMGLNAREIGDRLGLPSRQLVKRLSEQVKRGTIRTVEGSDGTNYRLAVYHTGV